MRSVLLIAFLFACGNKPAPDDKAAGSAAKSDDKPKSVAIDPALFGGACKQDFDCPQPEFESTCRVKCVKKTFDSPDPGYCQLDQVSAEVGAKNCIGNHQGAGDSGTTVDAKMPMAVNCDNDHGVYCDEAGTHTCVAVKAVGADCVQNYECGTDNTCVAKKCVAAGAPGQPAVDGHCNSKASVKDGQCVALVADGGDCKESSNCLSASCVYTDMAKGALGKCKPAKPASCALRPKH